jgi:hypothetical protein
MEHSSIQGDSEPWENLIGYFNLASFISKAYMHPLKRSSSPTNSSMDEREATRRKLMPPPLDDATDARWVLAVFETCDDEPFNAAYFLATIVSTSEGRLNPKYEKTPAAKSLLQEDSELMEKLRVAWKDRTLREISNLRTFAFCSLLNLAALKAHPAAVLQAEPLTLNPVGSRGYSRPGEDQEAGKLIWN